MIASVGGPALSKINLDAFQTQIANAGIAIQLGARDRERFSRLHPVEPYELEHAIAQAREKGATKPGYVLSVIEGERERAAELARQPVGPGASPSPLTRRGREIQAALATDPELFIKARKRDQEVFDADDKL